MTTGTRSGALCPRCSSPVLPGVRFCRHCGAELVDAAASPAPVDELVADAATPVVPAPPLATARPAARRRRWWRSGRLQLAVGVGLVVVVLAGYAVVAAVSAAHPPDGPVRALFDALAARDAARVAQLVSCEPAAMCSAAALATGYLPPEQVRILSTDYGEPVAGDQTRRPNKNRAGVRVSYRLADVEHHETVELTRRGGGLVRPWQITGPPGGLLDIVSTTTPTALLGGAEIATVTEVAAGERTTGAVRALPGVYTLAAVDTPLRAAVPSTVIVAGDLGRQTLTLDVKVKPAVVGVVSGQIRHRIDVCAKVADLRPDAGGGVLRNCPFSVVTAFTFVRGVRWKILEYPRIELREDDAGAVSVHTIAAGRARAAYEYTLDVIEPKEWTSTTEDVEITVDGGVEIDGTSVTWTG